MAAEADRVREAPTQHSSNTAQRYMLMPDEKQSCRERIAFNPASLVETSFNIPARCAPGCRSRTAS